MYCFPFWHFSSFFFAGQQALIQSLALAVSLLQRISQEQTSVAKLAPCSFRPLLFLSRSLSLSCPHRALGGEEKKKDREKKASRSVIQERKKERKKERSPFLSSFSRTGRTFSIKKKKEKEEEGKKKLTSRQLGLHKLETAVATPSLIFYNVRARRSGDRRILYCHGTSCDGFLSFEMEIGSVGHGVLLPLGCRTAGNHTNGRLLVLNDKQTFRIAGNENYFSFCYWIAAAASHQMQLKGNMHVHQLEITFEKSFPKGAFGSDPNTFVN